MKAVFTWGLECGFAVPSEQQGKKALLHNCGLDLQQQHPQGCRRLRSQQ